MESPKGRVYASGAIERIRNALDDYVDGWLNNKPNKMANAEEHLSITGNETLEIILLNKIKFLDKVGKKLNFLFWRLFYSREVYNYIYKRQPSINEKMKEGKSYKASEYYKAKKAFEDGIKSADAIIDKYKMWEIPGMKKAEHRLNYFWTAVISFIVTLIVAYLLKII